MLSSCAGKHETRAAHRPPPAAPAAPRAAPQAADAPEALWHLRAGLNVAALSCRGRGRTSVVGEYSRLLSRHRAVLDAAYRAEQRRYAGSGFDRHQTRLYNRFANQRSPQRFCQSAASIASRANGMDSARLGPAAPRLLGELEANLR